MSGFLYVILPSPKLTNITSTWVMDRCELHVVRGKPRSTHALRGAPYPSGCELKSSPLLNLTLAFASIALMLGETPKTGGAPLTLAGGATLHLDGVCEPSHIHPLSGGSVPLRRGWTR